MFPDPSPRPLIWINGWPAIGKHTVAQCLTQILGQDRAVLIDDTEFTDQLAMPPACTRSRGSSVASSGMHTVLLGEKHGTSGQRGSEWASGSTTVVGTETGSETGAETGTETGTAIGTGTTVSVADLGVFPGHYYRHFDGPDTPTLPPTTPPNRPLPPLPTKKLVDPIAAALQILQRQEEQKNQEALLERQAKTERDAKQTACFLKYVEDAASLGRIVIFTDCQGATDEGAREARAYEAAAERSGRPFVPVYLECDLEANMQRTRTSERRTSQLVTHQSCSPESLRALRADLDDQLYKFPASQHRGLSVDVTSQRAHDTAIKILTFMNEIADPIDFALQKC